MAKTRLLFAMLGACLLFTGCCCDLYCNAARTLLVEKVAFPRHIDRHSTRKQYRAWAECAWQEVLGTCPDVACSEDYEHGFKAGYVDYLYAGGTGEPPAVPPRCYWNLDYRSPGGHQAVTSWFAGFRHGAQVARDQGRRQVVTVPSSLRHSGAWGTDVLMADGMEILDSSPVISELPGEQLAPGVESPEVIPPPRAEPESPEELLHLERPEIPAEYDLPEPPSEPATTAPSLERPRDLGQLLQEPLRLPTKVDDEVDNLREIVPSHHEESLEKEELSIQATPPPGGKERKIKPMQYIIPFPTAQDGE